LKSFWTACLLDFYINKSENFSDTGIFFCSPTIYSLALVTTPSLTYYQEDRQFPESSTKGNAMGSGTAQFARHLPFYRCLRNVVLWLRKISPVAHKESVKFQICLIRFKNTRGIPEPRSPGLKAVPLPSPLP
jgi:hypothetical protein